MDDTKVKIEIDHAKEDFVSSSKISKTFTGSGKQS
tara:strand:+ start:1633 stop:1737 length:105 start_codon:yes stop_codon:yes gene_type:complete